MNFARAIAFWILVLVLSSTIVFAEVVGKWDSTENSCNCSVLLIIEKGADGSFSGKMNFPGGQSPIYNIVVDEDHISFRVDQPNNDKSVTYAYDAAVSGDNMTGTYAQVEPAGNPLGFSATRRTGE